MTPRRFAFGLAALGVAFALVCMVMGKGQFVIEMLAPSGVGWLAGYGLGRASRVWPG